MVFLLVSIIVVCGKIFCVLLGFSGVWFGFCFCFRGCFGLRLGVFLCDLFVVFDVVWSDLYVFYCLLLCCGFCGCGRSCYSYGYFSFSVLSPLQVSFGSLVLNIKSYQIS